MPDNLQLQQDLFSPPDDEHVVPPSESVYIDDGSEELQYVGEIQLPRPTPTELIIEIDGWDYVYKLDRRSKSQNV